MRTGCVDLIPWTHPRRMRTRTCVDQRDAGSEYSVANATTKRGAGKEHRKGPSDLREGILGDDVLHRRILMIDADGGGMAGLGLGRTRGRGCSKLDGTEYPLHKCRDDQTPTYLELAYGAHSSTAGRSNASSMEGSAEVVVERSLIRTIKRVQLDCTQMPPHRKEMVGWASNLNAAACLRKNCMKDKYMWYAKVETPDLCPRPYMELCGSDLQLRGGGRGWDIYQGNLVGRVCVGRAGWKQTAESVANQGQLSENQKGETMTPEVDSEVRDGDVLLNIPDTEEDRPRPASARSDVDIT
ncbi:hypothetical protein FB451DRAFT_1175969 [Mycena latifolia]|nr:hypothetical protein FB451DRAFT_1175969 [Mycena latifolia]